MFLRHTINKHIYRTVAPETSRNNAAEVRLTERRLRTLKPKTDTTIKKNGFKRNKNIKTLKNWQKELAEKLDKQNKSLKFHMSEMFGQIEEPQNLRRFNVSTPTVDDLKMNSANGNFTYWDAKWMQIQAGRGDRLEIKPHEADIHSTEIPPFNLVVDKAGQIKTNEQLAQVHNLSEDETKLMKIEQKLEGLKAEITSFAGVRSDNKFYELDETMMRLILLLDKLEINDQILRQRKKYLLKKIYKLSEELDCRAQQKELLKREKNLKTISKSLEVPHQNEEDIEKAKLYVKNIEKQREQITVNNENLMVDNDFHEGLQILEKEMKNQMLKYMHPLKECRRSSATIDHCIQQTRKLLIIEKKLKRVIDWLQIPQKISDDIERVNDCLKNIAKEIAQFDSYDGHHGLNEYCVPIYSMVYQRKQIFRAKLESDLNKRKGLTFLNYSYPVSNPPRNSRTIDNVAKSNAQRANTITTDGRLGSFNNSKNEKQHDIIPGEFNELGQHLAKTTANCQDLLEMKSAESKSIRKDQERLQKLRSTEKEESKTEEHRQRLNEVEDKLEALKPEIFPFVGVRSDKKFNELDGTVLGLILLLDRLEINDECLRKRKKCLLKNIHKLGEELDLRAQQEEFLNGEKNLKTRSNWLETPRKNEEDIDKAKLYVKNIEKQREQITVNNEALMVDNDFHEGLQILEKEMENQMLKYYPIKECRRSSATIDHCIQQTRKLLIIEKKLKRVIDWLQIPQKISDDIERVNDCLKNIAKEIAQFDSYDGHHGLNEYCVPIYSMVYQRKQIFRAKLESDLNKRKGLTFLNYSYPVSNPPRNSRTIDNVAKSNAQRANTITTDGRLGSFNNSKNEKQHDIIPGEFNELGQHLAKTPIPANRQDLLEMKSAESKSIRKDQERLQKLRSTEKEESKTEEHRQRLNEVEDKLEALKPEIFSFVGVRSDKKFNELDGTVLGLILLLDRLEINDECLRKRKKCLLKNIHKLGKELDLRAQQEKFLNGEKNLKTISNWLETPRKNEEDIDKAKSYIKSPQKLLEPIKVFISV